MIKKLLNPKFLKSAARVGAEGAAGAGIGIGVEKAYKRKFDKRKDIAPAFRGKRRRVVGRARANCPRIGN